MSHLGACVVTVAEIGFVVITYPPIDLECPVGEIVSRYIGDIREIAAPGFAAFGRLIGLGYVRHQFLGEWMDHAFRNDIETQQIVRAPSRRITELIPHPLIADLTRRKR